MGTGKSQIVPGLVAEAASLDLLILKQRPIIPELLELNSITSDRCAGLHV